MIGSKVIDWVPTVEVLAIIIITVIVFTIIIESIRRGSSRLSSIITDWNACKFRVPFFIIILFITDCYSTCNDDSFLCTCGMCIPDKFKCDGFPQCPDGSDENPQTCGKIHGARVQHPLIGVNVRYVCLVFVSLS